MNFSYYVTKIKSVVTIQIFSGICNSSYLCNNNKIRSIFLHFYTYKFQYNIANLFFNLLWLKCLS